MTSPNNTILVRLLAFATTIFLVFAPNLQAASKTEMRSEARRALNELYATTPAARRVGEAAKAVLVFPSMLKAGFVVGGQHGDGTLLSRGSAIGYYKSVAASYGLQAGAQKFGYALFFMNNDALAYLRKSGGWEIGSGPSLVVVDTGMAKTLTSTTLREGIYAFVFGQKGLMAGIGLQGTKVTQIHPD